MKKEISRDIIVGGLGSGKTTLILKKIIPALKDYVVFDFCDEYRLHVKNYSKVRYFHGLTGSRLKIEVINAINKISDSSTVIIDNSHLLYFPQPNKAFIPDKGFEWLIKELKNKSYVLAFQSLDQYDRTGITGYKNITFMQKSEFTIF